MRYLVVSCLLVGCVEHRVSTWRDTIAAASHGLRTDGEAMIEVEESEDYSRDRKRRRQRIRNSDNVDVELDLGQGASRRLELRVDKLLAGCPSAPFEPEQLSDPHSECLLARTRGPLVLERSQRARGALALMTASGVVFSGTIVCSLICEPPWSTASRVAVGAVAITGLASLAIVYIAKAGPGH